MQIAREVACVLASPAERKKILLKNYKLTFKNSSEELARSKPSQADINNSKIAWLSAVFGVQGKSKGKNKGKHNVPVRRNS
jgi:hypothetical protein